MATLNDLAVSVIKLGKTLERVNREIKAMNDKQPKVWLTVYEAKEIANLLVGYQCQNYDSFQSFKASRYEDVLLNRIEQATCSNTEQVGEKENESNSRNGFVGS